MHLKTRIASALIALAALAGLGLAAVPAGAATVPCHAIWSFRCSTPVVAQALIPANDLNPAADFALRYEGPNPSDGVAYGDLGINFSNTLGDGTEDFEWDLIGHVPTSGPGSYGFTSFDNQNYGGSAIYEVAYAPNGVDTNLCVTVSSKFRSNGLVLGNCIGRFNQAFAVTQHAPRMQDLTGPTGLYWYAFEAGHASTDAQQHNFLLDPHPGTPDGLAAVGTPVHAAPGVASVSMWSAIP